MPEEVAYLLEWFYQLAATRGGGWGPAPITYLELDAWARRLKIDPAPWEVAHIMTIDRIWFEVRAEKEKKTS